MCSVDIVLADPIFVGEGPSRSRVVVELTSMTVSGDRLNGKMAGSAAADWLTIVGTVGSIDVRATIDTDDGALVFAQYRGRTDVSGGPGSAPIYVAPVFETGDARYQWLNTIQAVGKGQLEGTDLRYEWFELR